MHISHDETKRNMDTDKPWLPVCASVGKLVNRWSGKSNLVVYVGKHAAMANGKLTAPALYRPLAAEIEVNTEACFGPVRPEHVDFSDHKGLLDHPKAVGAIYHEAMHARHSTWDMSAASAELTGPEFRAMTLLEETRIEGLGVKQDIKNRVFLRASALGIIMADLTDEEIAKLSETRQTAQIVGLTLARVTAGVLDPIDVKDVQAKAEEVLGLPLIEKLKQIWTKFQDMEFIDSKEALDKMYELAREWSKLVEDMAKEKGEPEEGEGEGEGGEMSEAMKDLLDALGAAVRGVGARASTEAQEDKAQEIRAERNAKADQKRKEQHENKDYANKVFSQDSGPVEGKTDSQLIKSRPPTVQERAAATIVSRELAKAKYRDRVRVESTSVLPPGRLRSRAVVQAAANKAQGLRVETQPWRRVQHKHTEDPNLTIGVMVDISGSMNGAMEPMASTAWILSEAVKKIQGKAAMVYYGSSVFPTLKPGQHLDEVKVYSAEDGSEDFNGGFKALDGGLNLLNGSGARLLVVVSDGAYGSYGGHGRVDQAEAAATWLKRCERAGVGVLWLGHGSAYGGRDGRFRAEDYTDQTDAVFIKASRDVVGDAMIIGRAGADALTKANAGR